MREDSYSKMVLADSPRLYFRLNELTGAVANGPGYVPDGTYSSDVKRGIGSAVENGDFAISVTNNANVSFVKDLTSFTGPFTMEFWIKPNSIPTVIEYAVAIGFAFIESNFSIHNSNLRLSLGLNIINSFELDGYFTPGKWAYIIALWDDDGFIKILKDGVRMVYTGPFAGPLRLGNGTHYIGRWVGGLDYPWDGEIDEVAIYSYALTESQIKAHYLKGNLTSLFKRARKAA